MSDDGDESVDPLDDALEEERDDRERSEADPVDAFVEDVTEHPDAGDEDPFAEMETGPVPEGDPFERLDDDGEGDAAGSDVSRPPDESRSSTNEPGTGSTGTEATDATASDDPFAGFEGSEGDPFGPGQTTFEQVDLNDVDPDGVWERVDSEDADDAAVQEVPGRRYVEVSKHSYCEQCEYFSAPPEVSCSHEGTRILEFTDMETVRLVDCPIVAERQALEDEG